MCDIFHSTRFADFKRKIARYVYSRSSDFKQKIARYVYSRSSTTRVTDFKRKIARYAYSSHLRKYNICSIVPCFRCKANSGKMHSRCSFKDERVFDVCNRGYAFECKEHTLTIDFAITDCLIRTCQTRGILARTMLISVSRH